MASEQFRYNVDKARLRLRKNPLQQYGLTTVIKGSPRTVCGNPINGMGLKARIGKRPPYLSLIHI